MLLRSATAYATTKTGPVEDDKLAEVLEAARLAPSGSNLQPWKLVVVRDRDTIRAMVHAVGGQQFVEQAPVLLVGCKNGKGYNVGHRYDGEIIDIAIALDHATLQAASMGLGTCWLGNYDGNEVRAILNIPSENPLWLSWRWDILTRPIHAGHGHASH